MKRRSAFFLQVMTVVIGLGALAFLLLEPRSEGRNIHATNFEIYFKDPFLAYVYVGSIPFFAALYRGFRLFGQVRESGSFSPDSVAALRTIQRYATALLGFVAGGIVFVILLGDKEDRPAGLVMGVFLALMTGTFVLTVAGWARRLQQALNLSDAGRS